MSKSASKIVGKVRSGTAVQARAKTTVSNILATAQKILVEKGLANLTIRSVANALGISVGNLAYYFPSKDSLLQALVGYVLDGYREVFEQAYRDFPDDSRQRFKAMIRYSIEDAKKPEVQGFFYQFWGLSKHNAQVAETRMKSHHDFVRQLVSLLRDIHPDKSSKDLNDMAIAILAFSEGFLIVYGCGDDSLAHSSNLDEHIFKQLVFMAELED